MSSSQPRTERRLGSPERVSLAGERLANALALRVVRSDHLRTGLERARIEHVHTTAEEVRQGAFEGDDVEQARVVVEVDQETRSLPASASPRATDPTTRTCRERWLRAIATMSSACRVSSARLGGGPSAGPGDVPPAVDVAKGSDTRTTLGDESLPSILEVEIEGAIGRIVARLAREAERFRVR